MDTDTKSPEVVHFDQWLATQERGTQARIYREHGISFATMWNAQKRKPLKRYETAKKLSQATGGIVSVEALCEPECH